MNHIGHLKSGDKKGLKAAENIINIKINNIGLIDKKQLIIMLNEFIRNGTSSKSKLTKEKAWSFVYIALNGKHEQNEKGIPTQVLDSIEKGLKQGLSNTDKIIQNGAFKILNFYDEINEIDRVEKLFGKSMSASAQKMFN